jgi:hypothetical protein
VARIVNGLRTSLAAASLPDLAFYPKSISIGGYQGGGLIDITSLDNEEYRTFATKELKTLAPFTLSCGYDDEFFDPDEIEPYLQNNDLWTLTLPSGATFAFWGVADSFSGGNHSEQEAEPIGSLVIIPTLTDNDYNEVRPVFTAAP